MKNKNCKWTKSQILESIRYWRKQLNEGNFLKSKDVCLDENSKLDKAANALNDLIDIHAEVKNVDVIIDGNRGDKSKKTNAIYISLRAQAARDGDDLDDKLDEILDTTKKSGLSITSDNIAMSKSKRSAYITPEFKSLDFVDFED